MVRYNTGGIPSFEHFLVTPDYKYMAKSLLTCSSHHRLTSHLNTQNDICSILNMHALFNLPTLAFLLASGLSASAARIVQDTNVEAGRVVARDTAPRCGIYTYVPIRNRKGCVLIL